MKKIFTLLLLCICINKASSQCSANFTYTINSSGNVTFSNTSIATSTSPAYNWYFGDYQSSSLVNPSNTYAGNGMYVVSLHLYDSISNTPCSSYISQTITISNTACLLSANISTYQSSGGLVWFYDNSIGTTALTTYTLDYGDNSSSNAILAHTYSASGLYTLTLTEENIPTCTSIYTTVINVSVLNCSLSANFNFNVSGGTVTFTNTTVGASASAYYNWNFGNGGSNLQNPLPNVYLYNGTYMVTLTVTDSTTFWCSSTITKTLAITNASCYANAAFTLAKDSTQIPIIVWNAFPTYPTNVVSAIWSWGDNTSTNALYPSHTYSAAGFYSVCLTVSVSCGTVSTTCVNSNIFKSSESMAMAQLNVVNLTTGIKNNSLQVKDNVLIKPNPNNGSFSIIDLGNKFEKIVIYDQLSRECFRNNTISDLNELKVNEDLPNGVYFVELRSANTKLVKKMIVADH